jgi:hypothetical protein
MNARKVLNSLLVSVMVLVLAQGTVMPAAAATYLVHAAQISTGGCVYNITDLDGNSVGYPTFYTFNDCYWSGDLTIHTSIARYDPVSDPVFDLTVAQQTADEITLVSPQDFQRLEVISLTDGKIVYRREKGSAGEKLPLPRKEFSFGDYMVTVYVAGDNLDGFYAFNKTEDGSIVELQRFHSWAQPDGLWRQVITYLDDGTVNLLLQRDDRSIQMIDGFTGVAKLCQKPYKIVYQGGVKDNLATSNGLELAHPSPAFTQWILNSYHVPTLRNYDDSGFDRYFGETFNLARPGAHIVSATLEIGVRNDDATDALGIGFVDAQGGFTNPQEYFYARLNSPQLGIQVGQYQAVTLDLGNLPPTGHPTSLISLLNSKGWLDVYVQDDSPVDYIALTVKYECNNLLTCQSVSGVYSSQQVSVTVNATINVSGTYALGTTVQANPNIAQPQSATFGPLFPPGSLVGINLANPAAGTWEGGRSKTSPALPFPVGTTGTFATILYTAMAPGLTWLTFANTVFSDRDGFVLPGTVSGCWIRVLSSGSIDGTAKYQGRLIHSGIQVTATGSVVQSATTIASGQYTITLLPGGGYAVRAYAPMYMPNCTTTSVTGGQTTHLPDTRILGGNLVNTLGGGSVAFDNNTVPDNQRFIDIGDAAFLAANIGLDTPQANINADFTIDGQNIVNTQDLAILGGNYGSSGCQPW